MPQIILCITVDFFELIIKIWGRNLGEGILGVHCIILSTFLFQRTLKFFILKFFCFFFFPQNKKVEVGRQKRKD